MRIVLLGAGGHARSVLDAINSLTGFKVAGLFDDNSSLWGTQQGGIPVIGGMDALAKAQILESNGFIVTIGDNQRRSELFRLAQNLGYRPVSIVHPKATVSSSARIGLGTVILANAAIGPGTQIGNNVIINTGAVVDHDCTLQDHVHVAQGAVLAGTVWVGKGALIPVGAAVASNCKIPAWTQGNPGQIYVKTGGSIK